MQDGLLPEILAYVGSGIERTWRSKVKMLTAKLK